MFSVCFVQVDPKACNPKGLQRQGGDQGPPIPNPRPPGPGQNRVS